MRHSFRRVSLLILLTISFYLYTHRHDYAWAAVLPREVASPATMLEVTGVKKDLWAIAAAERRHFALKNEYGSFEEMRTSGSLELEREGRGAYNYSIDTYSNSFRVIATYSGADRHAPRTISISQKMEFAQESSNQESDISPD